MHPFGKLLEGELAGRIGSEPSTPAPRLSCTDRIGPEDTIEISIEALGGERFLLMAAPREGRVRLQAFPVPLDLGPDEENLILAMEGTLPESGRATTRLRLPEDSSELGSCIFWQALLFGPDGIAKTNRGETRLIGA